MSEEIKLFKPPARKCLRHEIKGGARNTECALCRAYAEADDNIELARKVFLKKSKPLVPAKIEPQAPTEKAFSSPIFFSDELPLSGEDLFQKLSAELIREEEIEYVN